MKVSALSAIQARRDSQSSLSAASICWSILSTLSKLAAASGVRSLRRWHQPKPSMQILHSGITNCDLSGNELRSIRVSSKRGPSRVDCKGHTDRSCVELCRGCSDKLLCGISPDSISLEKKNQTNQNKRPKNERLASLRKSLAHQIAQTQKQFD